MAEILNENQYNLYEQFVQGQFYGTFMQSMGWAKLKHNWGHEIVVSRDKNGKIVGGTLVLIKPLPLGMSMLYSPRGPVCDYHNKKVLEDLLDGIKMLAKKYHAVLYKCDPSFEEDHDDMTQLFVELGFEHKARPAENETVQRRYNYILPNIDGWDEERLLASFSQKTRYNIRLAQKHGVTFSMGGEEYLDEFVRLSEITAKRDNFIDRPRGYYKRMLDSFGDSMKIALCFYEGQALSGAMVCNYGGKVTYIFGASDNIHRNVMPSYLMQLGMMRWALENDCYIYDFFGIPVNCDENSPSYGVYRFKKGFNGKVMAYVGEFDYVFKPLWNKMVMTAQSARRKHYAKRIEKTEK